MTLTEIRQQRIFFAFIHIPKCGGTTFHNILSRNLGDGYRNIYHGLLEGSIASDKLQTYIEGTNKRRGIGGHRLSLDLPFFKCSNVDIKAISFVRKPVERIRSGYFYIKSLPENISQNSTIRKYSHSYAEYLSFLIKNEKERNEIGKYQFNFLFGKKNASFDNLNQLIQSQKLFLFPLDKFTQSCLWLEKEFPSLIKDASFVSKNVRKNTVNDSLLRLEKQLEDLIVEDKKLYQIAENQLNQSIGNSFTQKELNKAEKDFNLRCLQRQYIYSPIQEFCCKFYRVSSLW